MFSKNGKVFVGLHIYSAAIMVFVLVGCSSNSSSLPGTTPEVNVSPAIRIRATASPASTDTPLLTPVAASVTSSVNLAATSQYWQTVTKESIIGEIDSNLESVQEVLGNGRVEYYRSEQETLQVQGFNKKKNSMLPIPSDVSDFAFHTKVTWNSDLGNAGCGLLYRAEKGDPGTGPYYEFLINRSSGLPYYNINLYDSYIFIKQIGSGFTGFIKDRQGDQNDILFIVKGTEFRIYINNQRSNALYDSTISTGKLALEASSLSGSTTCQFTDTWIWSWGKH
jgi:hypothetical protein